jgi:uncharacterized coiled-coil protein SlyX
MKVDMANEDLEKRVTELEVKLTYQDRLIEELNQVVIELRAEIERVAKGMRRVEQQIIADLPDAPNEPPPHY